MKLFSSIVITALFSLSSCYYFGGARVYGDGHIVTRDRSVGSFTGVRVGGAMNIHIKQDASQSVKIEADQNLMEYIDVYTDGSTLVIRTKQGYNLNPTKEVVAYISAPLFKDIDVSGSGDIIGDNLISSNEPLSMHVSGSGNIQMEVNVPKASTEVSGSGDVKLKGKATEFSVDMSGSGKVMCFDLVTDNTTLDMSGSSDAEVNASKKLDIDVSGSGSIHYKGSPSINQRISGSGEVKKVD